MENYTTEITSFTAVLAEMSSTRYEWSCYFILNDIPKYYRTIVFVEEYENVEFGWCWYGATPEIYLGDNEWEYCKGTSVNDLVFDHWRDHLFAQCVSLIKQHSKHRLRLFPFTDMEYGDEEFIPLTSYRIPEQVKMIEK
jgi:hypothetical protein